MSDNQTRLIPLPKGGELELEAKPGFYEKIRQHFDLPQGSYVDDDHIRMFIFGSVKSAIDKAEAPETRNDDQGTFAA